MPISTIVVARDAVIVLMLSDSLGVRVWVSCMMRILLLLMVILLLMKPRGFRLRVSVLV